MKKWKKSRKELTVEESLQKGLDFDFGVEVGIVRDWGKGRKRRNLKDLIFETLSSVKNTNEVTK